MIDSGLVKVLSEILNTPEESINAYFTEGKRKKEEKTSFTTKAPHVETSVSTKIDTILAEIQKTLKEDALQRHALELQLKAINKRIDDLEKKITQPEVAMDVESIYLFLKDIETDLEKELSNFSGKKNLTIEDSAKNYRCNIQLELVQDIIKFIQNE